MTKNHIDLRLLKSSIKLTLDKIITATNKISNAPLIKSVVDQTWNCKNTDTIKRMSINTLFLGSTLWVKVPNGEYLPKVTLFMFLPPRRYLSH